MRITGEGAWTEVLWKKKERKRERKERKRMRITGEGAWTEVLWRKGEKSFTHTTLGLNKMYINLKQIWHDSN